MPRLPRNIARRGDRYYLRICIDGRLIRKALGSDLEQAKIRAILERERLIRRHLQGLGVLEATFREFAERWVQEYVAFNRNPKGRRLAAQRMTQHVNPVLGRLRLSEIDRGALVRVRLELEAKKLSGNSVGHILSDLRCCLNYAVDLDLLRRSPFPRRKLMPKVPELLPRDLDNGQVNQILSILQSKYALAVRLALVTGLRWGELHGLQWIQVELELEPHLKLERTKSSRVRRVPLTTEALELLLEERERQRLCLRRPLFVLPFRGKNPGNFVRKSRALCGFHWHFHQLRHTFARRYLEQGGSLVVLQCILGHSTVRMTQRYAQLTDQHVLAEVRRIDLRSGYESGPSGPRIWSRLAG